jgi:hypothetical protein
LLYYFVDNHAVFVAYCIKLVDIDDTAVGEDYGDTFEVKLAGLDVDELE